MDYYLIEININYACNPQLHTLLIIFTLPLKLPFYYIHGGLKGSVSHGAVSMMIKTKQLCNVPNLYYHGNEIVESLNLHKNSIFTVNYLPSVKLCMNNSYKV